MQIQFGGTLPETNPALKVDPWKRPFLVETTIFRGYVSFRESNPYSPVNECFIENLAENAIPLVTFLG